MGLATKELTSLPRCTRQANKTFVMDNTTKPIVFKTQLGDDLRRFTVNQGLTFAEVLGRVSELFSIPQDDTLVRYKDDEDDWVTMTNDADLAEAVSIFSAAAPDAAKITLRLDITSPKPPRAKKAAMAEPQENGRSS